MISKKLLAFVLGSLAVVLALSLPAMAQTTSQSSTTTTTQNPPLAQSQSTTTTTSTIQQPRRNQPLNYRYHYQVQQAP